MNKKLLKRIDELFDEALKQKTGWGKNEVLELYRKCVNEAIMDMLD